MERVNITEAKSRFSEYLSHAAGGEHFVIVRRNRPLAAIISAGELERLDRAAEITRRLAQALDNLLPCWNELKRERFIQLWLHSAFGRVKKTWPISTNGFSKIATEGAGARTLTYEHA